MAVTCVHVMLDTVETPLVTVSKAGGTSTIKTEHDVLSPCHMSYLTDIDECSVGVVSCAENAECLDTDGSYECICSSGYTWNGTTCASE